MSQWQILRQKWLSLAARERLALSLAAWLVLLFVVWRVLLAPALQTVRQAPTEAAELDGQLQGMLAMQAQAQALQNRPKLNHDEAVRALDTSVKQQLAGAAQLSVQADSATLQLKAVGADALARWLVQARINARAVPVEAHLQRSAGDNADAPPQWSGTLVLALPAR